MVLRAGSRDLYIRSTTKNRNPRSVVVALIRGRAMFNHKTRSTVYDMHVDADTDEHTLRFLSRDGKTILFTPCTNKYVCLVDLARATVLRPGIKKTPFRNLTIERAISIWSTLFKRAFAEMGVGDHLNTSGHGVPWLHLRVERIPKHYCPVILKERVDKYMHKVRNTHTPYNYHNTPRFVDELRIFPKYYSNGRNRRQNKITTQRIDTLKPVVISLLVEHIETIKKAFDYLSSTLYNGSNVKLYLREAIIRIRSARLGVVREGFLLEADEASIVVSPGYMSDSYLIGTLLHESLHYICMIDDKLIDSHNEHMVMYLLGDDC